MSDVTVSIHIDIAPAALWSILEPIESHVDWMADAVAIRFETSQRRGVGTRFECDTKVGPIRLTDRMEITTWNPPGPAAAHHPEWRGTMGVLHRGLVTGDGAFTLDATATGGTTFTWSENLQFPWFLGGRWGARLAGRLVLGPIWKRNLRRLKELTDTTDLAPGPRSD